MTLVDEAVHSAEKHSDMRKEELYNVAEKFLSAHEAAPGGVSVEIGTREGGSAQLCLWLLDAIYDSAPPLITVDPYGTKPYNSGDCGLLAGMYDEAECAEMKRLLMEYDNHFHYRMRGEDFLESTFPIWWKGEELSRYFAFVLLDGDHDHRTVTLELALAERRLMPGGIVMIDNVDKDSLLQDQIVSTYPHVSITRDRPKGANQAWIQK